ncbi:MAG TPA: hypothetical protein VGQ17_04465 [Gemmatimonadales bacterium]|nr:hypothetical protein [Gemmatimonadales bacterium]
MDMTKVVAIVGLLVALSVASERLVEIIKGVIPPLTGKSTVQWKEGVRRTVNQLLAVGAGILTAYLARPAIPQEALPATNDTTIIALGLLASGGSGFWNAVLTYVLQVKDIKEAAVKTARTGAGLAVPK